jgi:hypothetical protein
MSLRTAYTGALDSKLAQARTSGRDFIVITNLATINTALLTNANSGLKKFTINLVLSYQTADLRLKGNLWEAYKTGILEGLAQQDIMGNECVPVMNLSDSVITSVDLNFTF